MAFLSINSWPLPVFAESTDFSRKELGRRFQTQRNKAKKFNRGQFFELSLSTPSLHRNTTTALVNLIQGKGHVFNFNGDFVAGSSLQSLNYSAGIDPSGGLNGGAMVVQNSGFAEFDAQLNTTQGYFIMVRKYLTGSATWETWALSSDGNLWKNGVSDAFIEVSNTIQVSLGKAQIHATNDFGAVTPVAYYDELVILPWIPTNEMAIAWTTQSAPFSPMPLLTINGDATQNTDKTVVGQTNNRGYVSGRSTDEALEILFTEVL